MPVSAERPSHRPVTGEYGGLEVGLAMSGRPLYLRMPEVWGVRLDGVLPAWCSAKDVILEMLRRNDVKGRVNRIIEYHGPDYHCGGTDFGAHVGDHMAVHRGQRRQVFRRHNWRAAGPGRPQSAQWWA